MNTLLVGLVADRFGQGSSSKERAGPGGAVLRCGGCDGACPYCLAGGDLRRGHPPPAKRQELSRPGGAILSGAGVFAVPVRQAWPGVSRRKRDRGRGHPASPSGTP